MTDHELLRFADAGGGLLALLALRENDAALWAAMASDVEMLERVRVAAESKTPGLGYVQALCRGLTGLDAKKP